MNNRNSCLNKQQNQEYQDVNPFYVIKTKQQNKVAETFQRIRSTCKAYHNTRNTKTL